MYNSLVCNKYCVYFGCYTQFSIIWRLGDDDKENAVEILNSLISKGYHQKLTGEHYVLREHWITKSKYRIYFTKIEQSLFTTKHKNVKKISDMTIILHFIGPNSMYQNKGLLNMYLVSVYIRLYFFCANHSIHLTA